MRRRFAETWSAPLGRNLVVRQAVLRYTCWGAIALVLLGVGIILVSRDSAVRAGSLPALSRQDTVIETRTRDASVDHLMLVGSDGRVIGGDETELAGRPFALPDDQVAPLEVDLSPQLREEDRAANLTELLPLALGALLAFQLAMLPLAISLARRVDRSQAERADILRRALMSSDLERRRIAQDLHDGVIQDLAGLSYALPTVAAKLSPGPSADRARETAQRMSAILAHDVAALRTLLTDIYPPDLGGDGLAAALDDLADGAAESQVVVQIDMKPGLEVPVDAARLAYRIVREGLRNVIRHAGASSAHVTVRRVGGDVLVRVSDDGRGLSDPAKGARGHLGVKLLADTVADFGGRLDLRAGASGGAVLEASFPVSMLS